MKLDQIIALDIGVRKTGIAKADMMGFVIKPIKTVATTQLEEELLSIQESFDIKKLVVGLPKNMDGTEGEQAKLVRQIAETVFFNLFDPSQTEMIFEDEKLTSEAATAKLKEEGIHISKDNKELVDSYAAALILEQYFQGSPRHVG